MQEERIKPARSLTPLQDAARKSDFYGIPSTNLTLKDLDYKEADFILFQSRNRLFLRVAEHNALGSTADIENSFKAELKKHWTDPKYLVVCDGYIEINGRDVFVYYSSDHLPSSMSRILEIEENRHVYFTAR